MEVPSDPQYRTSTAQSSIPRSAQWRDSRRVSKSSDQNRRRRRMSQSRPRPFQPVDLLKQTINFWALLLKQDADPIRRGVDLVSADLTSASRLIAELSSLLLDVPRADIEVVRSGTREGLASGSQTSLPEDSQGSDGSEAKTNRWVRNRAVLQNEFARLNIWKSDFSRGDIKLLLSEDNPLYRTILETILSLSETLLSLLREDGDVFAGLRALAADLKQMIVDGKRLTVHNPARNASPVPPEPLDISFKPRDASRLSGTATPDTLSDNLKDGDGDSIMSDGHTDTTQMTMVSEVDPCRLNEIEKLRHYINSLQDLEISMRRVLPYLRRQSNEAKLRRQNSSLSFGRRESISQLSQVSEESTGDRDGDMEPQDAQDSGMYVFGR